MTDFLKAQRLVEFRFEFQCVDAPGHTAKGSAIAAEHILIPDEYPAVKYLARKALLAYFANIAASMSWLKDRGWKVVRCERRTSEHEQFREVRYPVPVPMSLVDDSSFSTAMQLPQTWP